MNLTRAKFDELTRDLVDRTTIPVQNALKDAGLTASDLGSGTAGRRFYPYPGCSG